MYSAKKYTACCLGTSNALPYHGSHEICCDGQKFPKIRFNKCCYSPLGHAIPYNSSNHLCCDGNLHHGTTSTHLCCGGKSVPKPEPNAASPHYDCCETNIYDTITQLCCNGKIYEKIKYDACCFSADRPYHTAEFTCCCDKIYDKNRFDGCLRWKRLQHWHSYLLLASGAQEEKRTSVLQWCRCIVPCFYPEMLQRFYCYWEGVFLPMQSREKSTTCQTTIPRKVDFLVSIN